MFSYNGLAFDLIQLKRERSESGFGRSTTSSIDSPIHWTKEENYLSLLFRRNKWLTKNEKKHPWNATILNLLREFSHSL
jgi:hypothetical protein